MATIINSFKIHVLVFVCACRVAVCIIVTDAPPVKPEYKYSYEVVDPTTGDTKSLHEVKLGNVVTGSYSVVDPDGIKRIVDYTADSEHGFQAIVRNEPMTSHRNVKIPYSSLYQSHNLRAQKPYVFKNGIPISHTDIERYSVSNDFNEIRYFSPASELESNDAKFYRGEYFKPNIKH